MGSVERSKKKVQLWKKAIVHFSLCFVMGFFTGFAPSGKTTLLASRPISSNKIEFSPQPIEAAQNTANVNRSYVSETPIAQPGSSAHQEGVKLQEIEEESDTEPERELIPRRLLIIVTPTNADDRFQHVFLRRLANTIRLVPPPLLWIIVEKQQSGSDQVSEILRKTGTMYRHLVYKENFTDTESEMDHQRNVALRHIKQHELSGIVHFAGLSNIYDLDFFNELRGIETFGTWPMAMLSANRKRVNIEGPVCDSTQVIGWHIKKMNNETAVKPSIHISSFAFNSSILWDPERWGRPSASQATSQDSVKFVKEAVNEDETNVKGLPGEKCSKIMLWHLHYPIESTDSPYNHSTTHLDAIKR